MQNYFNTIADDLNFSEKIPHKTINLTLKVLTDRPTSTKLLKVFQIKRFINQRNQKSCSWGLANGINHFSLLLSYYHFTRCLDLLQF